MASIDHVLVAFDGTPLAEDALARALEQYPDATVTVLYVIDYIEGSYGAEAMIGPEELRERAHERSGEILAAAEAFAAERDRSIETASRIGRPETEILDFARKQGVDTIVIGSHGRSRLTRVLLGSVAETVVRRSPVPVLVVR